MERSVRNGILRRCVLFAGLSEAEIEDALHFFRAVCRKYRRGETMHNAGDVFSSFGLVLSGRVEVSTFGMEGEQMLMAVVTPGGTFGESLCFLRTPEPNVWAEAAEDSEVVWLSAARIADPGPDSAARDAVNRFITLLAGRTLAMNDRIQILSRISLREKLTTFLAEYRNGTGSHSFTVPFDRAGMAKYLGCERSALSRELSRMKADGLIDYTRNRFRILSDGT